MNRYSNIFQTIKAAAICICLAFLVACGASNTTKQASNTEQTVSKKTETPVKIPTASETGVSGNKILIMPLDVELSLLTAAGLQEPNAEWTQAAIGFMKDHLESQLKMSKVAEIEWYQRASDDPASDVIQLEKLHEALGAEMFMQQMMPLPTRKNSTERLTLGETAKILAQETGNDKALFVFVRDSYASAGRAAAMVFGALLGVGISGGYQVGFASLVDLNTGEVVWFNRLMRGTGDLRESEPAEKTVSYLLKGLPVR